MSGGVNEGTRYTLVETAEDHDERIRSERAVPERIENGEWPNDDKHLRAWKWIEIDDGWPWWWDAQAKRWRSEYMTSYGRRPLFGPWTRGERVTEIQEDGS